MSRKKYILVNPSIELNSVYLRKNKSFLTRNENRPYPFILRPFWCVFLCHKWRFNCSRYYLRTLAVYFEWETPLSKNIEW